MDTAEGRPPPAAVLVWLIAVSDNDANIYLHLISPVIQSLPIILLQLGVGQADCLRPGGVCSVYYEGGGRRREGGRREEDDLY